MIARPCLDDRASRRDNRRREVVTRSPPRRGDLVTGRDGSACPGGAQMRDGTYLPCGTEIRRLRVDCGLTQAELAIKAGIGKRTVERIEAGQPTTANFLGFVAG